MNGPKRLLRMHLAFALCCILTAPYVRAQQTSNENWDYGFGLPGSNGEITSLVYAEGDLFAAGQFSTASGEFINSIAQWNGSRWLPLGDGVYNGVQGVIESLAISGDNLYVGGTFGAAGGVRTQNIAVWNRRTRTWSALGDGIGGLINSSVSAIAVRGSDIYVGGSFIVAGKVVAVNIARWDGTRWHRVGTGINGTVKTIHIDDTHLYAAGSFTIAGDVRVRSLARYNLSTEVWEDAGGSIAGTVKTMMADDDYLYVGGEFSTINGRRFNNIARRDKATGEWSALGDGFVGPVLSLAKRGNDIIAGGGMYELVGRQLPRGYDVRRIAKWDGTDWSLFPRVSAISGESHPSSGVIKVTRFEDRNGSWGRDNGEGRVNSIAVGPDGELYLGGNFDVVGPAYVVPLLVPLATRVIPDPETALAYNICRVSGNDTVWLPIGGGLDGNVYALADAGANLYVGGDFANSSGERVNNLAILEKATRNWSKLGSGVNGTVLAMAVDGSDLYVGGRFSQAGGTNARGIARWSIPGRTWSAVGNANFDSVTSIVVGSGGDLYVGGNHGISKWNGSAWQAVSGMPNGPVYALALNGNTLYAGGRFTSAGGTASFNVASHNIAGGTWTALGAGVEGIVKALAYDNDRLFVGGLFEKAGGMEMNNVATWVPASSKWQPLGTGTDSVVNVLAQGRTGVYAGGTFVRADGTTVNSMAQWNGTEWIGLGSGMFNATRHGSVYALANTGESMYIGGDFVVSGIVPSYFIAHWFYPDGGTFLSVDEPVAGERTDGSVSLFPNPVRGRASLTIRMESSSDVSAALYNSRGEMIETVVDEKLGAGEHTVPLSLEHLSAGVYFIRVTDEKGTRTRTVIVE